ncbi:sigma factor-like helix-turn-helix DNA-binding protein [Sphingomonas sp. ERG5]|uniref:sigma-70 region 4 domain-containing protein n=1 Tax=Sphingomonas sp. ERG5 TaxID=1381597 RepID=UPI00054B24DE|nr:sigma-70 region 4 domain-containing protein [Sphingomonas sp. ERG5]
MIDPHALRCAFDALPERTRKVFWFYRVDDLSYAQIAERVGITIEEVQTEIANALYGIDRLLRDAARTDRELATADQGSRSRVDSCCWQRWWFRHW